MGSINFDKKSEFGRQFRQVQKKITELRKSFDYQLCYNAKYRINCKSLSSNAEIYLGKNVNG